jgi:cytochrome c
MSPTTADIVVIEPARAGERGGLAGIDSPALRGELAFAACAGCHPISAGEPRALAPTLFGVRGRDIATHPSYTYSPALQALAGAWTDAQLDAFIANPSAVAPGTTMRVAGIADSAVRADLIAYLRSLR